MPLRFPDSADSADLVAAGYSEVIILGGGTDSVSTSATADYLILAGGGGGGGIIAGGGGAGGYRTSWGTGADGSGGYSGGNSSLETALTLNNGTAYSITVGQGGEGGFGWNAAAALANPHQGRDTTISGSDITTITSDGGGGGNAYNHNTGAIKDGGSAGGGASVGNSSGTPTTGQGFSGGISGDTNAAGGGGGGAGQPGGNSNAGGSNTLAGTGGDGLASTITGTSIVRGGGGSGGARGAAGQYLGDYSTTPIPGGDGGGGVGGILNGRVPWVASGTNNASDGRAGYGGGGGGGAYTGVNASAINAGNGGSGIAIFRLPSTITYNASQLASDVSSDSNCTAFYLNTQVYTDDTNFGDVTLLLDGSSLTVDLSSAGKNFTSVGGANLLSTTGPYGTTQNVLNFDGVNDYLIETTASGDFTFGTDDFTIEAWLKADVAAPSVVPGVIDYDNSNTGSVTGKNDYFVLHQLNSTRTYAFYANNTSGNNVKIVEATFPNLTDFHHVAITRSGSTVKMFINGVLEDTSTNVLVANMTSDRVGPKLRLGYQDLASRYWNGQMADVRITKGVARYTSSFTPPTASLPNRETSTGGDHVISFTVATEDPYDGGATTNDGTATWTPTLTTTTLAPSTTWTIPEGVDSFSIMAIGAGGAAGYSNSTSAGGGGGGGGLAYLNNIAVAQGDLSVQSITVGGGQLGVGADSNGINGGDASDLTVTMNLSSGLAANLSGYNVNPYGQAYYDSDSDAKGIMFVGANRAYDSDLFDSYPTLNLNFDDSNSSTADQFVYVQPTGPFGAAAPIALGTDEGQINLFNILNSFETNKNTILAAAFEDSGIGIYTTNYGTNYAFIKPDQIASAPFDSNMYFDSPGPYSLNIDQYPTTGGYGATNGAPQAGTGAAQLFAIGQNFQTVLIGGLPGASPYVDSLGQIIISNTGDPYDYNGYGPSDLNQILLIKNLTP